MLMSVFRYALALCLAVVSAVSAEQASVPVEPGTAYHFEGRLAPADSTDAGQTIDWYLVATPTQGDGDSGRLGWVWIVEAAGRGGWDWTRSFGIASDGGKHAPATLAFEHHVGNYVIRLPAWQWSVSDWQPGRNWKTSRGRVTWTVAGRESRSDDKPDLWKVVARTPVGVRRTLWIDATTGMLVRLEERIFMGRGEKYDLRLKLAGHSTLDEDAVDEVLRVCRSLDELRGRLGKRQDAGSVPWSKKQLETLAAYQLPQPPRWAPLKRLLQSIERDRKQQHRQAGALEALAQRVQGQNIRDISFRDAGGNQVPWRSIAKKVTVLHFWEYRDSPLKPPYGQVGFLDFLSRHRTTDDVAIVGVVVHPPGDASARSSTVRSSKKLSQFMNLSYPLVYDDGSVLRQIGDPRTLGVSLPMYVVVDESGQIVAHHFGLYPADPSRGLEELAAEIERARKRGG